MSGQLLDFRIGGRQRLVRPPFFRIGDIAFQRRDQPLGQRDQPFDAGVS